MDINIYQLLEVAILLLSLGIGAIIVFLLLSKNSIIKKRFVIWLLFKQSIIWIMVILINVIAGIGEYISGVETWYLSIFMACYVGIIYILTRANRDKIQI